MDGFDARAFGSFGEFARDKKILPDLIFLYTGFPI